MYRVFFVLALQFCAFFSLSANELADTLQQVEEKFNAGDVILHHVLDANEIHVIGPISIPLPVILYTNEGLDVFSYAQFLDEEHEPHHIYTSPSTGNSYEYHHGHIARVDASGKEVAHAGWNVSEHSFLDFSITKNVAGVFLAVVLMFFIFTSVARGYRRREGQAPKGLQSFMEPLILFIRDEVAKPTIGHNYARYMPFLLSIFFFIWISNLLGLIPFLGGLNITGNIAVTLVLATFTFIVTSISANKGYWSHIVAPPGVPFWLLPIMIPIEILGVFTKPIVLTLRLFANITAGHIIILSFTCLIFIFNDIAGAGTAYGVSIGTLAFNIFMTCLELLVAFLQAYVFTLLSAIYFGQATEEHH